MMNVTLGRGHNSLKSIIITAITLLIFGVGTIILGNVMSKKGSDWIPTKAEIVNVRSRSDTYDVYVNYEFDDIEYHNRKLDTYVLGMKVNDIIDIKVNPVNPNEFKYASSTLYPAIYGVGGGLIGIGVLTAAIGIPVTLRKRKVAENEQKSDLKSNILKKMK